MNGKSVVLDTNSLLYFLNGDPDVSSFLFDYQPIVSFVTELELLSAPELSVSEKLSIQEILKDLTIVSYTKEHKNDIVKLRAQKKLRLPDAIIASLAITLGLPLVTADKALRNIPDIDVIFYKVPDNG